MAEEKVLDLDALTLGDIEDMEEYVGQPIGRIALLLDRAGREGGDAFLAMPAKLLTVAAWLAERTKNPRATLAETRMRPFSEVMAEVREFAPNSPAPAAAGGAPADS